LKREPTEVIGHKSTSYPFPNLESAMLAGQPIVIVDSDDEEDELANDLPPPPAGFSSFFGVTW